MMKSEKRPTLTHGSEWAAAEDRQEPEHYHLYGCDLVATVEYKDRKATIEVCGDMRYRDRDGYLVIRNGSDLEGYGIKTDDQLKAALDSGELICDNNPWYEVWCDGEYSEPCFSQGECIAAAEEMLLHPLDSAGNVRAV